MDTPRCSEIPNSSADWKLNPNVECRIILNKLKIKTPEYETMEFCRTLKNLSVPKEPATAVFSTTTDVNFKSEFVLDILLNETLGKCEEKCKVCEEYVQQLRHHISQAHSGHPNPSPHAQTVTVFRCDICSSIYSSPSMLIRHRNTHSVNSDTLTTPCTNEPEPVQFDSNSIYTLFDISSVTTKTESVSSGQCENHPHQPVPPNNVEGTFLKQEELSLSHSQMEMSNSNPLGILQHMNHLSTIENNLKQECNDLECEEDLHDPLLLQDLEVPSFVKSEYSGMSTESEQLLTYEKSSNDTNTGRESFPVPSDLIRHKITYSGQKPYKCDICGKCFGKSHHLTRHKLIHSGEMDHKCGVCGKCFTFNCQLTQHKLTHIGEKPYECDVCGKCFGQRFVLKRHKLTHTAERPHSCDVCGMCFAQRANLTSHKLTHTGEKPHTCDLCGDRFYRHSQLTQHKLKHTREKLYECNVCEKKFVTQSTLTQHKLVHTGERLHKCDICGHSFYQHSQLTKHKIVHTGEKLHKCDVCGKSFFRRGCLMRHTLTHTGEKSYVCDVCGREFALNSNLTQHKLTHTGEGSFSCDVCGKCFPIRSNLRKHILIHTGEKPYKCDVCGKCFLRRYVLVQHKLTHTGETSFYCEVCGQRFDGRHDLTQHKLLHTYLKEERESEEERCKEDPLLNLDAPS